MVDAIRTVEEAKTLSSSGNGEETTGMAASSAPSETPPRAAKKHTRRRRKRASKVDAQSRLEIAQSALAQLAEAGVKAYVIEDGDSVIVTIVGVKIVEKKFTLVSNGQPP